MKQFKLLVIGLAAISLLFLPFMPVSAESTTLPKDDRTQRIFKQETIISEGNALVERGLYSEAIVKFQEALDPSVLNEESDKGRSIYFIEKVYKLQGKYEEALKELQWSIDKNPHGTGWLDEKLELEALIKSHDTGSPEPVHAHIRYLNNKYQKFLPPQGFNTYSNTLISTILRLYDTIGDLDGGIAFIDMCMEFFKQQDIKKYGEYRPGHADEEFKKVREAFERDKAEGKKGRATQALIQSDYFPW